MTSVKFRLLPSDRGTITAVVEKYRLHRHGMLEVIMLVRDNGSVMHPLWLRGGILRNYHEHGVDLKRLMRANKATYGIVQPGTFILRCTVNGAGVVKLAILDPTYVDQESFIAKCRTNDVSDAPELEYLRQFLRKVRLSTKDYLRGRIEMADHFASGGSVYDLVNPDESDMP